jgi:hypothetical protein
MIQKGMGRAFLVSVIFGTCFGYWILNLSIWSSVITGILGYFITTIMFQTIFHWTKSGPLKAYQINPKPEILSSDAYRGIWTFPIIATIILALFGEWLPYQTIHTYRPVVIISGVTLCACYTGYASGYMP